jgi:ketosteroid isomerase-like protein
MGYKTIFYVLLLFFPFVACHTFAKKDNTLAATTDSKTNSSLHENWQAFIKKMHDANREFAKGEMKKTRTIWSHGEDVTIFGGYGGLVEPGWQNVESRLTWASEQFTDGSYAATEIKTDTSKDLGYILQTEQWAFPGKPVMNLRVTMICRKESDGWKIVHRHGEIVKPS